MSSRSGPTGKALVFAFSSGASKGDASCTCDFPDDCASERAAISVGAITGGAACDCGDADGGAADGGHPKPGGRGRGGGED